MELVTDPIFRLLREALEVIITHHDPSSAIALLDPVVARFSNERSTVRKNDLRYLYLFAMN